MRSSDATEDVFGCAVRPAGKAHRFDVLSHVIWHLSTEAFIAEMETDIEKPQLEESRLDLRPFQPLFWSIRKRTGSAYG